MTKSEKAQAAMSALDKTIEERQNNDPPKPVGSSIHSFPAGLPANPSGAPSVPVKAPSLGDYITNIDLTTWRGRAMLVAASNPGDMDFGQAQEVRLLATSFAIFPDSGVNPETGEVSEFSRTVLFDREGRTFRTTAAFAPRKMQALLSLFTPDEWRDGIPLVISRRLSPKTGRNYHDIRVSMERDPAQHTS